MDVKITMRSMEILRKQYRHMHLTESQVSDLVQYSLDEAEKENKIISEENSGALIFCLCAESTYGNAVFAKLSKDPVNNVWNVYRVYYRKPGAKHPPGETELPEELFEQFPDLADQVETLTDMRLKAWQPEVSDTINDKDLLVTYDVIRECVKESFEEYTSRIYDPAAFGFSISVQITTITDDLMKTYEAARDDGKVFSVDSYFGCITNMTNANGETLFLIVSNDDEDYFAKICSFYDIEGIFHRDAEKIKKEISFFAEQSSGFKSMLWRFAGFYSNEYSALYNGEGIAQNVRLIKETWSYENPDDPDSEIRALGQYIEGTFLRVLYEGKLWILDGNKQRTDDPNKKYYAVFNTGLVDITYKPVYMIFKWGHKGWVVDSFRTCNNGVLAGKDESECPPKADYICRDIMRTMYCTDDEIVCNWRTPKISEDHVFENLSRLPEAVQKYCLGDKYEEFKNADKNTAALLVSEIPNDKRRRFLRALNEAVKVAVSRAAWNMKTGVPVYYYRDGSVNVLLPLSLQKALNYELGEETEDTSSVCDAAALMVLSCDTISDGNTKMKYECKTVYSLSMAYRNARLINRPESDWLTPTENK